nr:reverse transcriptase domain-containing protein [Tanacetum cinerariifolium]
MSFKTFKKGIISRSSLRLVSNPSSNPTPSTNPNPKGRNRRCSKQRIEEFNLDELSPPIVMMADQRTMAQLLQAPTEGYEDAIVVPAITVDNFELKHGLLTLVQNKQFFGDDKEDPHTHIRYFNKITYTLKFPNVPNTSIKLMLFPFSLEGTARIWLEKEPPRSIFTWDDLVSKFINQFFPPSKTTNLRNEITNFNRVLMNLLVKHRTDSKIFLELVLIMVSKDQDSLNSAVGGNFLGKMPRECLAIIESKSKVCYPCNKPVVAKLSTNTSTSGISPDVAELKDMVKALLLDNKSQNQAPATVKAVEESYVACGGAHSYRNCPATDGNVYRDNIQEFVSQASAVNYNQGNTSYHPLMMSNQIRHPGFPPVPNNQKVQLNQRNNQNRFNQNQNQGNNFNHGTVYQPSIFHPPAYQAPVYQATAPQTQGISKEDFSAYVKANDAFVKSNNASTSSSGTLPSNTIANLRSDLKAITTQSGVSYDGPQILPPPSFLPKVMENKPDATKDTVHPTNDGSTKDDQPQLVLQGLTKDHQFLIHPECKIKSSVTKLTTNFGPSIKSLLTNKDKLCELSRTPLNEHCSAVLLNKLPEKLGDPGKFLIPCYFPGMAKYLDLADLDASINIMPLSVWNKLSLPDLTPTCITLKLADHSISRPVGVAEDVYVKVGELTLLVGKEAITFNLDQTSRYLAYYNDMTEKRIDVIDMACEKYSHDFLLEEVDAFLAIEDDPTSLEVDQSYLSPEGDILLLEAFLNDDPSLPPLNQGNYLPEVELKDLPPYLEYAFLEGDDKFTIIIVKDLSMEEKTALITVLKSHKRAIAWKLSDIKVHYVPKKDGFTVVENKDNELILTRLVTGWHICIDYRKLNEATRKDHFPQPFIDQMLERLARNQYYCFLDGFSGYFQIPIDLQDQEITTFTCTYGTFAYRRMLFGLCNAPGMFQRYMMAIFHDMIEKTMEVFMDDFLVFGNSFQSCLSYLERMLKSNFAIGEVLGQRQDKHFRPIHYASKTMTKAESSYTTTEKEMLAVVYAFEKFRSYLIMNKSIVDTDHSALKYLFAKKDSKARLLRWVLLLQEFTFKVINTKGAENLAADHLSRLENPHQNVLDPKEIISSRDTQFGFYSDCVCSIETVKDKILVPKPPKNCARCTKCGYLVDGPNCQGCTLLRQELEENLVAYAPDFKNTSEPSNASTNVVNAPREPNVAKQDNGSFVDKIIFRAPDSPDQFHCFHCKAVLRAGEGCKRCTCAKCGSRIGKGLCYICGHNQNSLNDSPSISETSSQSPPNINHCCSECGDSLDGIFCKRCTCPSKVPVISIPEPYNNQTINELPQALPIFHPTFQSEAESPFTLDSTPTYVDESPNVFNPHP